MCNCKKWQGSKTCRWLILMFQHQVIIRQDMPIYSKSCSDNHVMENAMQPAAPWQAEPASSPWWLDDPCGQLVPDNGHCNCNLGHMALSLQIVHHTSIHTQWAWQHCNKTKRRTEASCGAAQTIWSNKLNSRKVRNSYIQKEKDETVTALTAMCRLAERRTATFNIIQ
jgi:hypothetical protein